MNESQLCISYSSHKTLLFLTVKNLGFEIPVVLRLMISRSCWRQCMQVLQAVGDDRPVMTGEGGLSTTMSCDESENSGNERKTVNEYNKDE